MFSGLSLTTKLIGAAIAVSVLLGVWAGITRSYYNKGWYAGQDALIDSIRKKDANAASHAQERRNEMDKCYDAGREWSQSRGVCIDK